MNRTLDEFLTGIIDYAGLFPPAGLEMRAAVRNFSAHAKGQYGRWQGRFVVPVGRLEEFADAAAAETLDVWRLSVLAGADLQSDLETIERFNHDHVAAGVAPIDAIELRASSPEQIRAAVDLIPSGLTSFFEIPIAHDPMDLINAIADTGVRAKVRTGGVTAESIPSPADLARFIVGCADQDVAFKATAGLHHPFRSIHRLTYEPESATALMHGFLNVFLAAAFAQNGMEARRLEQILEERSPAAFAFEDGAVSWRSHQVVRAHLRNTRSLFALSFGSCSFEEPIEDLKTTGLL